MDEIWDRLETYLKQHAQKMFDGLAPGAEETEIANFEATVGYQLPDDVRQSLRRHNGQRYEDGYVIGGSLIPDCWALQSIGGMLGEWEEHRANSEDLGDQRDPEVGNPGVKPLFLNAAWIPFACDVGGNSLCIDLDPDEGGTSGQIIEFDHEGDSPTRFAANFRSLLTSLIEGLETGIYVYDENPHYGGFRLRSETTRES
jgi:cell wall assembly regulator SMI1